tara:strand:- start:1051 stop:1263 length:213 start_codon:yes stop_codon:yes gene_type:complete
MTTIQKFISKVDGCEFDYFIAESTDTTFSHYQILSFRVEGTDNWQDFIPNDKRAYSPDQYQEMMNLLEGN